MRYIAAIICFMAALVANADQCAQRWQNNRSALVAIAFLESVAGYHKGENCEVSIRTCGEDFNDPNGSIVGEVLVRDKSGRELYLPIDIKSRNTVKTKFSIENGRRMFHYEYRDNNREVLNSGFEAYLFEIVKSEDLSRIEYVEFGIREPSKKRIFWSVCRIRG
jgi:hypothetical protein